MKGSTEWEVKSNFKENLGGDGYVYGLDIDGFTGVYWFPNSLSCIYKICTTSYTSIIPQ